MNQLFEFAGNHLILVSAFFFVLSMLFVNLLQGAGMSMVYPAQAVQLLNRDDAVPLDLRSAEDFAGGHIINAVNIPRAELKDRLTDLGKHKGKPILIYCATGTQSNAVLKELGAADFSDLHVLKGGIAAWRAENLPVS